VVVLAAGDGKRMRSRLPKVMHRIGGRPLLGHVLAAVAQLSPERTVVVVSPRRAEIEQGLGAAANGITLAVQDPPRGTADAARVGLDALGGVKGEVVVLPGDTPLITGRTLVALLEAHRSAGAAATLLTARAADPTGYGRVLRGADGGVSAIVEERDASDEQRQVDEINSGVYVFDAARLGALVGKVGSANAQDEYYLTDVIELLRAEGDAVAAFTTDEDEVRGVNSRAQLAEAGTLMRARVCAELMEGGVTIIDPATTYIDATVTVEPDATILPFTFLEGETVVRRGAEVGPNSRLVDTEVGEDARITYSVARAARLGPRSSVGPYATLRPGTELGEGARLGSFVETKNARLGPNSKANHLSYLGDADIGANVNIGAGTITCNWDGRAKHRTVIEDDVYISSDTMLVAPVRLGQGAATGAGAVVRDDVPPGALAVGVPARIVEGKGNRIRLRGGGEND
jgi:bifunctional UDP-N-acetylglucosamine pyrophosphorylase/glucosamine-1-phosphate N-acetyltransferase